MMSPLDTPHPDLSIAQKHAYEPLGLSYKHLVLEKEDQEYGACEFLLYKRIVKFRVAKITPIKTGQFVTFWKRTESGPIAPYDSDDPFDMLIVSVRSGHRLGQFVFPKALLLMHNVIAKDNIGGKRALRVYPPWDVANNLQAKKTQAWQLPCFFEIQPNMLAIDRLNQLFFN